MRLGLCIIPLRPLSGRGPRPRSCPSGCWEWSLSLPVVHLCMTSHRDPRLTCRCCCSPSWWHQNSVGPARAHTHTHTVTIVLMSWDTQVGDQQEPRMTACLTDPLKTFISYTYNKKTHLGFPPRCGLVGFGLIERRSLDSCTSVRGLRTRRRLALGSFPSLWAAQVSLSE